MSIDLHNLTKWVGNDKFGVWEYGQYRSTYLVIRRLDNGKYMPVQGASTNIDYPGVPLPANNRFEYDTFDQAKNHCFKYVDYIRDIVDIKRKQDLHTRLHNARPDIFPA